jgi:hypothetical protein
MIIDSSLAVTSEAYKTNIYPNQPNLFIAKSNSIFDKYLAFTWTLEKSSGGSYSDVSSQVTQPLNTRGIYFWTGVDPFSDYKVKVKASAQNLDSPVVEKAVN